MTLNFIKNLVIYRIDRWEEDHIIKINKKKIKKSSYSKVSSPLKLNPNPLDGNKNVYKKLC